MGNPVSDWWKNVTSGTYAKQNQQAGEDFWLNGGGKGIHDFFFGQKASAPQQRQVDYGQSNEDRAQQMALLAQLQSQYAGMANGTGPSLAQGQLQHATDQNISQAMALGAAQQGQGLGYASALRNIADQSAAARQQAAAQSAMIRNAEQMQGTQGLAGVAGLYGGVRGQDLGQAGMQQQGNQFYDALNFQASQANANHGALPGILNAGGAILGMGLGGPAGAAAGGQAGNVITGGWNPNTTPALAHGGMVRGYSGGGPVDSTRNDTVPAMLSPGEVVIPRSITLAPDAPERAKAFVAAIIAHRQRLPEPDEHPVVRAARKKAA